MNDWVKVIVELLTMLAAMIPLVYNLVEYVKKAVQEKNWSKLIEIVYKYVVIAETKFTEGADKKEWVIAMIKGSADMINYTVNEEELGQLIDDIIAVTKKVNSPQEVIDAIEEEKHNG